MPLDPGRVVVALAYPDPGSDTDYDLHVVIAAADGQRIWSRRKLAKEYVSDARRLTGLQVDTGRYDLGDGVRAVGVRAEFSGSSRVNPAGETVLSLFVQCGRTLAPVLRRLRVNAARGETDDNCSGELESTESTIAVGRTSSHGYADLVVRSTTTRSRTRPAPARRGKEAGCQTILGQPAVGVTTLHFDGRQYPSPSPGR